MSRPTLAYDLALAAAQDAGNRSMRKGGRVAWNDDDYNTMCAEFNRLIPPPRVDSTHLDKAKETPIIGSTMSERIPVAYVACPLCKGVADMVRENALAAARAEGRREGAEAALRYVYRTHDGDVAAQPRVEAMIARGLAALGYGEKAK